MLKLAVKFRLPLLVRFGYVMVYTALLLVSGLQAVLSRIMARTTPGRRELLAHKWKAKLRRHRMIKKLAVANKHQPLRWKLQQLLNTLPNRVPKPNRKIDTAKTLIANAICE